MSNRRDVLLGLGSAIGVTGLSVGVLASRRHALDYRFDEIGGWVWALDGQASACTAGTVSHPQIEGPFYTPQTPERRDIRDPVVGATSLIVMGRVLDSQCRPIAGAILDFWQTDRSGVYDQQGYRYRGHQYTDADGRFELVTARPHAFGSSAWLPLSRLGVLLFAAALTTLVIVLVGSVRSGHLHAITLALLAAITLDVQIPILFFSQPASLEHLQGDLGVPWFLVPLAFAVLVGLTVPCLVRLRHTSSMARTAGITVNQLGDP